MEDNQEFFDWIRDIQRSNQPEADKLKEFFGRVTAQILEYGEKEVELARAMQDRESLVKHQIKLETIKTARSIFARGFQLATGRTAWDEQDKR
jgi:hypothetical protein